MSQKVQHDPPGPPAPLHRQHQGLNATHSKSWAPTPELVAPGVIVRSK
jgi:hypothetical protein